MNCETLISEVFSRKPLWNISHPQHHNRGVLDKLWAEISKIMIFPVKKLRQKWKYLRDQFRGELKKIPVTRSGEEGGSSYEPTWPYFHLLLFLKDQMTPNEMSGNILSSCSSQPTATVAPQDSQEYDENSEDRQVEPETQSQASVQSANTHITVQRQPTIPSTHSTRKRSIISTRAMNAKLLKLEERKLELLTEQKTSNQEEISDHYHFFMSLLPAMKKFSDFQKFKIRTKIQQIIMDEMSNSSNISSGPSTPRSYDESRPMSASSNHLMQDSGEYSYGPSYQTPTLIPLSSQDSQPDLQFDSSCNSLQYRTHRI